MYDICCIGHITADKVVTATSVNYMPGGTAFYFSYAINKLNVDYLLVTALGGAEMHYVEKMREAGIEIKVQQSAHTVYFENIYAEDQDIRTQNVLQTADAFTMEQLADIEARVFHLGPLLADDFSIYVIQELSKKGIVALDVQGYLRKVVNYKVVPVDWLWKKEALLYISILKADVNELLTLTGQKDVKNGCLQLTDWGVKEVVITDGSNGSLIYKDGAFYDIPAYQPKTIVDATGCGDTYMAGYLYKRSKNAEIQESGEFAAAMAGLKTAIAGPFTGTEQDVMRFLGKY
ncbi:PfkB family carbohydrate kinase [Mucilaginibacter sp. X4EP1]|uniref:PfkB family carbohydrate kinase n=1 Tax=Mucilaginibacter sp. X4EP1 TaxID=2723092 RepID=UPI00216A02D9|nr:PfkB family carbohydrate kinase [Mucilaginibacter sp. X4EP1]MCS3812252.1 sugar/nucleoside kinase (ribokinase family) [Mucilaginibacter sp. X4EP1]